MAKIQDLELEDEEEESEFEEDDGSDEDTDEPASDDEDTDEDEEEEQPRRKKLVPASRLSKKLRRKVPEEAKIKARFVTFNQPPRIGIADGETGEVVGEGELMIPQVLANILATLERIENVLGSMVE